MWRDRQRKVELKVRNGVEGSVNALAVTMHRGPLFLSTSPHELFHLAVFSASLLFNVGPAIQYDSLSVPGDAVVG